MWVKKYKISKLRVPGKPSPLGFDTKNCLGLQKQMIFENLRSRMEDQYNQRKISLIPKIILKCN